MEVFHVVGVGILLGLVWMAAFLQLSIVLWTLIIGIALLVLFVGGYLSLLLLFLFGIPYVAAALFANGTRWRQRHFVPYVMTFLRKQMPPISATEREALVAGNTWWEKELFCGRPQWSKLLAMPHPTLTAEEVSFLDNQVDELCERINDWELLYDKRNIPESIWSYLKQEKFFGLVIPKQYGGHGFSALAHSTMVTKIASRSMSAAVSTMVPNSLGPAELLLHYGTEEQKNYYLPRLASGEEVPCFALTAPDAGSDAGAIPDSGVICHGEVNGKKTIGIKLNWDKRYITLAPIATLVGLAVRLYDPDHLLGDKEDLGITLCLIPASHPGVEIGTRHYPLLLAFLNGPTRGKDVFVPLDYIIGGVDMIGKGWMMLMECLSIGRSISLPALATACGKITYRYTGAYARVRRQFNTPLSSFEGIEEALGYIAGYSYMLEACRIMTASAVDQQVRPSTASAIAKYHMTEMARVAIERAMDIHAGHGIQMGPRNFLGYLHIAMPVSITVEGANILTRNLIIFGQGAIRCHPYLLKEIELISNPNTTIADLDKTLMSHIGYSVSHLLRNIAYGLSGGLFIFSHVKNKRIRKLERQLTRMSAALALLADSTFLLLGGSLKRRERISARLGDILSQLYLASTVLKFYHDNQQSPAEVDYVCWSLQECLYKIQVAIDGLLLNYPRPWMGKLLQRIVFPFGRAYYQPSDMLHKKIVKPMLEPSSLRDRITQYSYISDNENEASYRLEKALLNVEEIELLYKKLKQNTALTDIEKQALAEFEILKNEIIKVNEFTFDLKEIVA